MNIGNKTHCNRNEELHLRGAYNQCKSMKNKSLISIKCKWKLQKLSRKKEQKTEYPRYGGK